MSRTRYRVLLGGLLLTAATAGAQPAVSPPDIPRQPDRRWVLKFPFLSLLDIDNTVSLGAERLLGDHHAVQVEAGFGWLGINLAGQTQGNRYQTRDVWRGRAEYRYYVHPTAPGSGLYLALDGFYKKIDGLEAVTVGVGCATGNCQYYQYTTQHARKFTWGGHLKVGRQFSLSANGRLVGDLYVGLGARTRFIRRDTPPGTVYYTNDKLFEISTFRQPEGTIPSLALGIKLGYRL